MADERIAAKARVRATQENDTEFDQALLRSQETEAKLAHSRQMRGLELGFIGRWLGGEHNAPLALAGGAVVFSLVIYILCLIAAGLYDKERAQYFAAAADKILAFATGAMGFVFGKAGKNSK